MSPYKFCVIEELFPFLSNQCALNECSLRLNGLFDLKKKKSISGKLLYRRDNLGVEVKKEKI